MIATVVLVFFTCHQKSEAKTLIGLQGGWTSMTSLKYKEGDYQYKNLHSWRGGYGELYINQIKELSDTLYVSYGPYLRYAGLKGTGWEYSVYQKPTHSLMIGFEARAGGIFGRIFDLHLRMGIAYSALIPPKYSSITVSNTTLHGVSWKIIPEITFRFANMFGIAVGLGYVGAYHAHKTWSRHHHGIQLGLGLEVYI